MRFAAAYEKTPTGWSAYAPDLPGLGVAGATIGETREHLPEAIVLDVEDLRATGQPTPKPKTQADSLEVPLKG